MVVIFSIFLFIAAAMLATLGYGAIMARAFHCRGHCCNTAARAGAHHACSHRANEDLEMTKEDDCDRTNSLGLFNTAEAYWLSAIALEEAKVKNGHAQNVVRFLYYHSLELYLKALLRQKHSVEKISKKFGHRMKRLVEEAEKLGLVVADEDRKVFSIMADTDAVIEARYIRTGAKTWPTFEALRHTCKSVRGGVGDYLRTAGVLVRL